MTSPDLRSHDWFLEKTLRYEKTITPRVVLEEPDGMRPMRRHNRMFGLLGGHVLMDEIPPNFNIHAIHHSDFTPTVKRETKEESGLNLDTYVSTATLLGIATVHIVDQTRNKFIQAISPIYHCFIPKGLPFANDIVRFPAHVVPKRLYPDAAMAMYYLEWLHQHGFQRIITNTNLNDWGPVVFMIRPKRKYILGRPPIEQLHLNIKEPNIPKSLPRDTREWLHEQFVKRY